jgi:hypothetical protein
MTPKEILLNAGFEDVFLLENCSYEDALIGVTTDNRAVYSFSKMVEWLMINEGLSSEDAEDWIYYNTVRGLKYYGPEAPIIMYDLEDYR